MLGFSLSDITWEAVGGGLLIALARMLDVALGVLRMASSINGRRKSALAIAFFEALIWVFVVAGVIHNLANPIYAVFYAIGFAIGTFLGITLEGVLARGEQVIRIFTHKGDAMAQVFRNLGIRVTQFEGKGLQGPIQLLFIHIMRRKALQIPAIARECDPECFLVVDDVRSSSLGFRSNIQRK
jgi:uncharacterized protein YebE (UPF0316 family)